MKKVALIAEDDYIQSTALEMLLKKAEYEMVKTCRTGRELIENILNRKPDLILADLFLDDEITGLDAINKIREKITTPVIFITGQSPDTVDHRVKHVENSLLLFKPITVDDLNKAIRKISEYEIKESH